MSTRVLFSTNQRIGSIVIRAATWSEYSHCDILNPDPNARSIIGASWKTGVAEYGFDERVGMSTKWQVFEVAADERAVWDYARLQVGKKYDWLGCLGIAVRRDWQEDDSWFCSELVAKAVLEGGVSLVNPSVRFNRITPQMILNSPFVG